MALERVEPWAVPEKSDCFFYHSIDLPNGETILGAWDFRDRFDQYIGGVSLQGKTVLDVGTAGGFLAFSAEAAGASAVTAMDVRSFLDQNRVPFINTDYTNNKIEWAATHAPELDRQKKAFWYSWHKLSSKVQVCYNNIDELYSIDEKFDIVFAGALMEHLADPVSALGAICRVATETVVVAFTPVDDTSNELFMRQLVPWTPETAYVWWVLSKELYTSIFNGMGFDPAFLPSSAMRRETGIIHEVPRQTIVARRR